MSLIAFTGTPRGLTAIAGGSITFAVSTAGGNSHIRRDG
jgi:hypothetical protein